jgi:hypothetical protein
MRARINKWDCINLKNFLHSKRTIAKETEWEKIFARYSSEKVLISRLHKELKKLNTKGTSSLIDKRANELNRQF